MKRLLLPVLVLVPATVAILFFFSEGLSGNRMTLAGPDKATTRRAEHRAPVGDRSGLIDFGAGRGTELFSAEPRTVVIDGDAVEFQRTLFAAATSVGDAPGVMRTTGLTVIINPVPKKSGDASRLVYVDTKISGPAGCDRVRAAFAAGRATGVSAGRGLIHGTGALKAVSGIDLDDAVHVIFVDPETPEGRTDLATESLAISFTAGEPERATSSVPVRLERPIRRDLEARGNGVDFDFRRGEFSFLSDVTIHVVPPGPGVRPPVHLTSRGRAVLTTPPVEGRHVATFTPQAMHMTGGVTLQQGELVCTGDEADFTFASAGGRLSSATVRGHVTWVTTSASFFGDLLTLSFAEAMSPRAELFGSPVTAKLRDGARMLPGGGAGDLTMTTAGTVLVLPSADEQPVSGVHEIRVGPTVHFEGTDTTLDAASATVWTGTAATPEAPDHPSQHRTEPFRASFVKPVGHTPTLAFHAETMRVRRDRDASGIPTNDHITLVGDYEVRFKDSGAAPPVASRPARGVRGERSASRATPSGTPLLIARGDTLIARGHDEFEITHPPLDDAAILAAARNGVELRVEVPGASEPRGVLTALFAELVLQPVVIREPTPHIVHQLASFIARRSVVLDLPHMLSAHAGVLTHDPASGELVLERGASNDRARLDILSNAEAPQIMRANRIVYHALTDRVVAIGECAGELLVPPLPWIDGGGHEKVVKTVLTGQRVVVNLDRSSPTGGVVAHDVLAEGGVKVTQPDRALACDWFSFDSKRRSGSMRGAPFRYEVHRTVDGHTLVDELKAPQGTLLGEQAICEGPVSGVLHLSPERFALSMTRVPGAPVAPSAPVVPGQPADRPASRPGSTPEPLVFSGRGHATFTSDVVHLEKHVELTQGNPSAEGFHAEAESADLFVLRPPPGVSSPLEVGLGVLQGGALYRSRQVDADGDRMEFNRVVKRFTVRNESGNRVKLRLGDHGYSGSLQETVSRLDVDFSNPDNPIMLSTDVVARPAGADATGWTGDKP